MTVPYIPKPAKFSVFDFFKDFSLSSLVTALIAVTVSYAGPAVIIFQATTAGHLSNAQLASWLWAVSLGSGLAGLILSLKYKAPVITAWSTPGVAILVTALPLYSYPEAVGAFIISAILIVLAGMTGAFSWVMHKIPDNIISAMLAGILFNFGIQIFTLYQVSPSLIISTVLTYLFAKKYVPRYAVLLALIVGLGIATGLNLINFDQINVSVVTPVFTVPKFSLGALLGITVPLFLVTMSSQNAPGYGVLKEAGYDLPLSPLVTVTGFASLIFAPFGAHGINLAAITAAICTGSDSHVDPNKRYVAGVLCGVLYISIGIVGVVIASVFQSLPKPLIFSIAGLALLGALSTSLTKTLSDNPHKEIAILTFLLTASNISIFNIGSAFWGLIFGVVASLLYPMKKL